MFHEDSYVEHASESKEKAKQNSKIIDATPGLWLALESEFVCDSEVCYQGNSDEIATERRLRHGVKNEKMEYNAKK
jgi:hypothetical protein